MDKGFLSIVGVTLIVLAVLIAIAVSADKKEASVVARDLCIEHQGLGMHIHPEVSIKVDGEPVEIPANIGITEGCMKAVHTHDTSGTIHLEYIKPHDFVLGDFFANWGQPFSQTQLMDKTVDDQHEIVVKVDGEVSTDYEKLVLKDKQKVEIEYKSK